MRRKLCRICWNSSGWRYPTGEAAQLESKNSYVSQHGYGTEEWLFNYEWLIDGYRYGFLQPIAKFIDTYSEQETDICLYTVSPERARVLVGVIRNVYIPDLFERERIYKIMKERGWIKQMRDDCLTYREETGTSLFSQNSLKEGGVINIRFRPVDVERFEPMKRVGRNHAIYKNSHYHPLNWTGRVPSSQPYLAGKWQSKGSEKRSERTRLRAAQAAGTYDPVHTKIQNRVYDLLCDHYGKSHVSYERDYVDLSVRTSRKTIFIEIKTATTAKQCIREALGQLLEYAHYPSAKRSIELVVMGDSLLTEEDRSYLNFLKTRFGLPIFYSRYIWEEECLQDWGSHI